MKNKLNPDYLVNGTSIIPYLILILIGFVIIILGIMRVTVEQNLWGKMLGYSKIVFKNSNTPCSFTEIVRSYRLKNEINKQIKLFYKI